MTLATTDQTLRLRDGRTLGYAEYGDPSGTPVIFFHGNPGSRLMHHPDESVTAALGVRMIAPDRPGYGLSDLHRSRTLLDHADDVAQLADSLGIDTFAVMGVSAGGPYVAATAYALPERVTRAAIVSGSAPFDRENPYAGVNETYTAAYKLARYPIWLLRPLVAMRDRADMRDRETYRDGVISRANDDDRRVLSRPEVKDQVLGYLPESTRQGSKGRVVEAKLLVAPFGFDLSQIKTPVSLWYWEGDSIVPPDMGHYYDAQIPKSTLHVLPNGGHFAFFDAWQDILTDLTQAQE